MHVERLRVLGFGALRDLDLELAPGLTVVTGPNEAGKSTLHAALGVALFGFFAGADRRQERERANLHDRYQPWGGGPYGLDVTVARAGGDRLRLRWTFGKRDEVVANDAVTGADRSAEVRGPASGTVDAATLWGVTQPLFERALCTRQGALDAPGARDAAALRTGLESSAVVASGGSVPVSRAVGLLGRAIEQVGSDRASIRPLPQARAEERRLCQQLEEAEAAREEAEAYALALRDAEGEAETCAAAAADARMRLDSARLAAVETRARDVRAALDAAAKLREVVAPPHDARALDAARDALAEHGRLEAEAVEAAARWTAAAEECATVRAALRAAEARADALPPDGPDDAVLEAAERDGARVEAALAALPAAAAAPAEARWPIALAIVLALAAAVLTLASAPPLAPIAAALGGLAALALWVFARARARAVGQERATTRAQAESALAHARAALAATLATAGAPDLESLRRAATRKRQGEVARAEVARLQAELAPLASSESHAVRSRSAADEAWRHAAWRLGSAGIHAGDAAAAAAAVAKARAELDAAREAGARADAAEARAAGLLGRETLADLGVRAAAMRARGILPDPEADEDAATAVFERAEGANRSAREKLADRRGRQATALQSLPDVAALREQHAASVVRVAQLERRRAALTLAREALNEAASRAHRDLAPGLNAFVGRSLDRVTSGRYSQTYTDDDFVVRVDAPGRGVVHPDELSRGTADQVHLLARLGLASLLAGADLPPLLLDDPLAHADVERREALIRLLGELAGAGRQIVLFVTDENVAAAIAEAADGALVQLPAPLRAQAQAQLAM